MSKIKYFSETEIKKFFRAIKAGKNVRDMLFFKLMYTYGLRLNEACGLKLEDFTDNGQVAISRSKNGIGRSYNVSTEDRKLIKRWLRIRDKIKDARMNEYLFITSHSGTSEHLTDSMGKKSHTKYCDTAGINSDKRTNPHAWRHTRGIQLLMQGFDINFVKHYLGHRSLQSTLVYAELMPPEWLKLSKKAVEAALQF